MIFFEKPTSTCLDHPDIYRSTILVLRLGSLALGFGEGADIGHWLVEQMVCVFCGGRRLLRDGKVNFGSTMFKKELGTRCFKDVGCWTERFNQY